jgi:ribosomal protein L29
MKTKELYEKDNKTLAKMRTDARAQVVKDRFKIASREMTKVSEIAKSKKLIARINTILKQREILEAEKVETKKGDAK